MRKASVVLLVAIALLGSVAALRLQQLRAHAREEVARALGELLGGRAQVREADLDFAALSLRARGVTLADASGRQVLAADELRLRVSWRSLLRGRIEPRAVQLRRATLRASLGAGGAAAEDWLARLLRRSGAAERLAGLSLRDSRVLLQLPDSGSLSLAHASLQLSGGGALHARLEAGDARLQRAGAELLSGGLRARGVLHPGAGATRGQGQLWLEHARLQGRALGRALALSWHADAGRVGLRGTLELGAGAGTLGLSAALQPGRDGTLQLTLEPHALRLRAALTQLGLAPPACDALLEGRVQLRGTLQPLALSGPLALELRALRVDGAQAASGARGAAWLALASVKSRADLRIDAAGVALHGLQAQVAGSTLAGEARAGWNGALDATLAGDQVELADFSPLAGAAVAGHGRVALQARGALQAPELHASLALGGGSLAGVELGRTLAELEVQDGGHSLRFTRAEIAGAQRRLIAQPLALRIAGGLAELHAKVRIARLPLADLYRLLGAADDPALSRLQGVAAGNAELDFAREPHASQGGKLELGLSLALGDASLDGYRFDGGKLQARIELPDAERGLGTGALTLQQLALQADGGKLELAGKLERGALAMSLALDKLPLQRLPWLQSYLPQITGRVRGTGALSGSSEQPRARAELALDALALAGHKLGGAQLRARLLGAGDDASESGAAASTSASGCGAGRAALRGATAGAWLICGEGLGGRLHADLGLSASAERSVRGSLALDDFDLSAFLPERAPGVRSHGALSARLSFEGGGLAQPERLSARLQVRKLELGQGALALASPKPFELQVREGKLELHEGRLLGPKIELALGASGTLRKQPQLLADGTAAASLFTRSSEPLVQAFGDVGVHVAWSLGTEPRLRAEAETSEVLVRVEPGMSLRKLHGKLVLEDGRVTLDGVSAQVGGGTLQVGGQLALQGLHVGSYDLAITADRVALEPEPKLEVTFDCDSHLRWSGGDTVPELTGSFGVKDLLFGRHIQLPQALTSLNRQDRADMASFSAARDRLRFDLELEQQGALRVRNNFLDAELAVQGADHKLRVVGSDQRFGVVGKLAITRGRVLFHGDQFQVTRGEVAFDDAKRVAPKFDVRAVADRHKRADSNIVFMARGDRDAFDLHVKCEPYAGTADTPPFTCDYAKDQLRCDSFERLVQLWLCRSKPEFSSAR